MVEILDVQQFSKELFAFAGDRVFLLDTDRVYTYHELHQHVKAIHGILRPYAAAGLWRLTGIHLLSTLIASSFLDARFVFFHHATDPETIQSLVRAHQYSTCFTDDPALENHPLFSRFSFSDSPLPELPHGRTEGQLGILTSGTTGIPKISVHRWNSLSAKIKVSDPSLPNQDTWLLTYTPTSFAGLQVILQAFFSGARLIYPQRRSASEFIDLIHRYQPSHISSTPTFWRTLFYNTSSSDRKAWRFKQITLGGEIVTQDVLDMLRRDFPDAHITHIYALTEMGVVFSVHDKQAGFPTRYLDALPTGKIQLAIQDNELLVSSPHRIDQYVNSDFVMEEGDWYKTGDMVAIENDRVYFRGRKNAIINVGGSKVFPEEVERIILQVAGVKDACIYPAPNPITGNILCAEIVPATAETEELGKAIRDHCKGKMEKYKIPRILHFVNEITRSENDKINRARRES